MSFIADMFGGGNAGVTSAVPAVPAVAPPTPMPDPKGQKDAKKRSLAEMMRRKGRASTILTDTSSDALGG